MDKDKRDKSLFLAGMSLTGFMLITNSEANAQTLIENDSEINQNQSEKVENVDYSDEFENSHINSDGLQIINAESETSEKVNTIKFNNIENENQSCNDEVLDNVTDSVVLQDNRDNEVNSDDEKYSENNSAEINNSTHYSSSLVDGYYSRGTINTPVDVIDQRDSNHEGWISRSIYYIESDNDKISTESLLGQEVTITKKSKLNNQDYAYVTLSNGIEGWLPQSGILQKSIQPKDTNMRAWVSRSIGTIDSIPYGTDGARRIGYTKSCLGDYVDVLKGADTARGKFYYIDNPKNKELSGWISGEYLLLHQNYPIQDRNMTGWISRSIETINTKPYATEDSVIKGYTSDNLGKEINILQEADTARGRYYYVESKDGKLNGWIHSRAIIEKNLIQLRL